MPYQSVCQLSAITLVCIRSFALHVMPHANEFPHPSSGNKVCPHHHPSIDPFTRSYHALSLYRRTTVNIPWSIPGIRTYPIPSTARHTQYFSLPCLPHGDPLVWHPIVGGRHSRMETEQVSIEDVADVGILHVQGRPRFARMEDIVTSSCDKTRINVQSKGDS
ncbi:hypothetical protein EDB81DRAFT_778127 [Dactylonectria macrodidyma]|uniref:Uncharacterized protein n=1 Tax=Dactylonectria macrodidyma TaxID=307937 RepID=A0A9P9FQP4_9HYPO|nr:hypothetical protein EDB81DRAFT_778127 [Dactylonectria macrodidyma]